MAASLVIFRKAIGMLVILITLLVAGVMPRTLGVHLGVPGTFCL
jgi:hypothetical protein